MQHVPFVEKIDPQLPSYSAKHSMREQLQGKGQHDKGEVRPTGEAPESISPEAGWWWD